MNFEKVRRKNRKAISPVLATVILIAITLIAAIAIAGFVFGLFGSFTSSAQVSVVNTALKDGTAAAGPTGTIGAQNTGTSNANINSVSLTFGGVTCSEAVATPPTVTAGATYTLTLPSFANACPASSPGEAFTGSLAMSNGGQVPFSGLFS